MNGREAKARFPYQTWNMFDRVREGRPRTNNSIEGWHHAMKLNLPDHPPVHKVAKKYRAEQKSKSLLREHHLAGRVRNWAKSKRKYRLQTERLVSFCDRFDSGVLYGLTYLKQVAIATHIPMS